VNVPLLYHLAGEFVTVARDKPELVLVEIIVLLVIRFFRIQRIPKKVESFYEKADGGKEVSRKRLPPGLLHNMSRKKEGKESIEKERERKRREI
jgi:hypothetical protein